MNVFVHSSFFRIRYNGAMQSGLNLVESRSALESAHDALRREELGRFLRDCRSRLTPADVGLPSHGFRRVRGLRREEVAELADVSVTWYTCFELATAPRVSLHFASTIADVLRLNETERTFLFSLLGAPLESPVAEERARAFEAIVTGADPSAVIALDAGLGIISANQIWQRLFGDGANDRIGHRNILDCIFEDAMLESHIDGWETLAGFGCGALRMQLARGWAAARPTFERFSKDPLFMEHWQRRTLYDPQDAELRFAVEHPVMGRIPLRLLGFGLYHSSHIVFVVSGDGDIACQRMQWLRDPSAALLTLQNSDRSKMTS